MSNDRAQYELDYQKKNLRQFRLALNRMTEQDVIDHLEQQPNIRQYIIGLIKSDMAKRSE